MLFNLKNVVNKRNNKLLRFKAPFLKTNFGFIVSDILYSVD
jgi:hypothetical protein